MTTDELKKEAEEYFEDETEGTFQICEDCYWFADAVQTAYVDSAEPREKRIAELEKENAELKEELKKWKDEWQEQVQKATDEGYARTLQTIQLSKAKELLKRAQSYTENLDDEADKLYDEIEQFLNSEGK